MKYFIKTFGCQQNVADSERVAASFKARGMKPAKGYQDANYVVLNTCMVRRSAEDRVYGLVHNLGKVKEEKHKQKELFKIIVTGCMVGVAYRDKSGKFFQKIREMMPQVDEFMPIEEVGFDNEPVRQVGKHAWVPISNGCNNFCTFCIVPFTRGREISRPYEDIINECKSLIERGYESVMLLGQNVNSYGADLIVGEKNIQVMRDIDKTYFETNSKSQTPLSKSKQETIEEYEFNGKKIKPVYVTHLNRQRIPTLFPYLLEEVAQMGFKKVDFISSNPWDFSDELIDVIARNANISRTIHLPVQSGDSTVLKRMNRWYTAEQYLELVKKIKAQVPDIRFTTDIIVGFCGETEEEFENTYKLAQEVGFEKAYIAIYSVRPMTAATKVFQDDIPHEIKKKRWEKLENLINKPNLNKETYKFGYSQYTAVREA
jgi:tRNA-2-methylthio-N6-dimethylallyladenosine synthase